MVPIYNETFRGQLCAGQHKWKNTRHDTSAVVVVCRECKSTLKCAINDANIPMMHLKKYFGHELDQNTKRYHRHNNLTQEAEERLNASIQDNKQTIL